MRKTLALLIFATGVLIISSCRKETCAGISCLNGGNCNNGSCACALGFEDSVCQTETRTKYLGNLTGNEICNVTNATVPVSITTLAGDVTRVNITNLYGSGFTATGKVQSNGSIVIAGQAFGLAQISGTAQIVSGKIQISYVLTATGSTDNCTWTQY